MAAATVPGPRGRWLVGDLENYVADRIGWLRDTKNAYGDVVRISPDTLVVHDPAVAHRVLAQTNDTFLLETGQLAGRRRRAAAMARLGRWMAVRRTIWHGFADALAASHLSRVTASAHTVLDRYAGTDNDLVESCRMATGRLIVDFCLGGTTDGAGTDLRSEAASRAHALFSDAQAVLTQGESRRRLWRRPLATAAAEADSRLRDLLTEAVAERRTHRRSGPPGDLLDALISPVNDGSSPSGGSSPKAPPTDLVLDDDLVVSALRMAMFASHGVPGAALTWIVMRLAAAPETADAVRREAVAAGVGERAVSPEDLPRTTAVVREVLRLHPPQWLLTRTALRTTEIGGYPVRAGRQVLVCPYLLHRDERYWPRPETFDPDRWMSGQTPHPPHTYLPFGAGPRICPGSALALSQLVILTAILASDYVLRAPNAETVDVTCNGLLLPTRARGGWQRRADEA